MKTSFPLTLSSDKEQFEMIFDYSSSNRKKMIFDANRGFWRIPKQIEVVHKILFDNLYADSSSGNYLKIKIVDSSAIAVLNPGQASIFRQNDKSSINLLAELKADFQSKYSAKALDGVLLEVGFYKNLRDDHDWIIMVN